MGRRRRPPPRLGRGRGVSPGRLRPRLDAAGRELSAPLDEAADLERATAEGAAALGRKVFDRAGDRALVAEGSAAGTPGAPARRRRRSVRPRAAILCWPRSRAGASKARTCATRLPLRSRPPRHRRRRFHSSGFPPRCTRRLAAPPRAAPAPGFRAPAAAPITFERLSLELGSGLVVKIRAALGFAPPRRRRLRRRRGEGDGARGVRAASARARRSRRRSGSSGAASSKASPRPRPPRPRPRPLCCRRPRSTRRAPPAPAPAPGRRAAVRRLARAGLPRSGGSPRPAVGLVGARPDARGPRAAQRTPLNKRAAFPSLDTRPGCAYPSRE